MKKTIFLILFTLTSVIYSQSNPTGNLLGKVVDNSTKSPLIGVNVYLKDGKTGASTDLNGNYRIENLPVGTYTVHFSYIGFNKVTKTDIIIKSKRTTYLNIDLQYSPIESETIVVESGYFSDVESKPVSTVNFSAEEIRRAPGSSGDVSRILFGLPSLAKVNDTRNSLIVRGGSPLENSFYLDNIEIPNINHFQVQGSSDGPIGLINVDFIDDVNFYSGGFSSIYGDRLSSIMELSFREGSKEQFNSQLNMSMNGFGGSFEGPLGDNGSFMFSVNRSYLDLIVDAVQTGGALPKYWDIQGKVDYSLNNKNKLTLLTIFSKDNIESEYKDALEAEAILYGGLDNLSNVVGLNWQYIWGESGYSNTSLSHIYTSYDRVWGQTKTHQRVLDNFSKENRIKLRNVNYYKINKYNSLEFGVEATGINNNFDFTYYEWQNYYGDVSPVLSVDRKLNSLKSSIFVEHHWNITDRLKLNYGFRSDYFEYNDKINNAPRANLSYKIDSKTNLTASAGTFYQEIPNIILIQNDNFKELSTPKSNHYILGLNRMIGESTKLSIEAYYKDYSNFPINPDEPQLFLFDQVITTGGFFLSHKNLVDDGKAISKGVEVMVQKKLASDFYGLASASYSKARYKDLNGTWRDRIYDNIYNVTLEGGYIPNDEWEFKVRWIYAGGAPYTPFDKALSSQNNTGIWDVNRINEERLPDYHSLNVRVDKRFYFSSSNLIVYLSIWNAYMRENIARYEWNEIRNEEREKLQWSTLPVLGFEFEF